jgi:carboxypeptidase PM20D1
MQSYKFQLSFLFLILITSCENTFSKNITSDSVTFQRASLDLASNFLANYLKFNSIPGNEQEAGKYFSDFCSEMGLKVRILTDEEGSYNFAASLYDLRSNKPNIILLNHIDVISADEEHWEFPPFSAVVRDGYIYGRGAIDCKGLAAMQLTALLDLKREYPNHNFPFNVSILGVSNEEEGGKLGAKRIIDEFFDELKPVLVLGEGGSGIKEVISSRPQTDVYGISVAEKSSLWLRLELHYLTYSHGATPAINYANKLMIDALNRINTSKIKLKFNKSNKLMFKSLGKEEKGLRGFVMRNIHWDLLSPIVKKMVKTDPLIASFLSNTVTVTNIFNPPGPPNKIASTSTAILDCRLLPGTTKKAFIKQLKRRLKEPNIQISIIDESPDAEFTRPEKFYKMFEKAITDFNPDAVVVPVLFPATTDNGFFREKGVPVYGLIPAMMDDETLSSIHGVNERISFDQLESGIKIYTNFLENAMSIPTKPRRIKDYLKRIKRKNKK